MKQLMYLAVPLCLFFLAVTAKADSTQTQSFDFTLNCKTCGQPSGAPADYIAPPFLEGVIVTDLISPGTYEVESISGVEIDISGPFDNPTIVTTPFSSSNVPQPASFAEEGAVLPEIGFSSFGTGGAFCFEPNGLCVEGDGDDAIWYDGAPEGASPQDSGDLTLTPVPAPEPGTYALLLVAFAALSLSLRKRPSERLL